MTKEITPKDDDQDDDVDEGNEGGEDEGGEGEGMIDERTNKNLIMNLQRVLRLTIIALIGIVGLFKAELLADKAYEKYQGKELDKIAGQICKDGQEVSLEFEEGLNKRSEPSGRLWVIGARIDTDFAGKRKTWERTLSSKMILRLIRTYSLACSFKKGDQVILPDLLIDGAVVRSIMVTDGFIVADGLRFYHYKANELDTESVEVGVQGSWHSAGNFSIDMPSFVSKDGLGYKEDPRDLTLLEDRFTYLEYLYHANTDSCPYPLPTDVIVSSPVKESKQ